MDHSCGHTAQACGARDTAARADLTLRNCSPMGASTRFILTLNCSYGSLIIGKQAGGCHVALSHEHHPNTQGVREVVVPELLTYGERMQGRRTLLEMTDS